MNEKETQEFELEDILKEFADEPVAAEITSREEGAEDLQAPSEVYGEEEAIELDEEVFDTPPVFEEDSGVTAETIRLDTIGFPKGQVQNVQPVEEPEEPEAPEEPEEPESFTGEWEPEYEQPIGEYIPPQPIQFHPRSRLRELKRKLVAGPEKAYYALSEKGLGKLQVAIFLSLLVVLISGIATGMYALGMVQENRLRLLVFGQFLAMLLSALLGSNQLIEGVSDLFQKRFTLNTLLVFTFMVCCLDGVLGLRQLRIPCCAAFSLQMTMSLWSAYEARNTRLGQLDTMRKATRLDGIVAVENYYGEMAGFVRAEGQVEDFMDHYEAPSKPEKALSVYALVVLFAGIAVGIVGGILHGFGAGIQVTAVTLLAAVPATVFVTLSRPMAVLERRLHDFGTVLCGWQGVEALNQKGVFPLTHADLFPAGTVKMNGVKFFGAEEPDEIVACCTALINAGNEGLAPLFNQLLESRNGIHYQVQDLKLYDGGLGGVVNDREVLVGSLSFLRDMEVELPQGIRVGHAVCVALDGELCGLFAVTYESDRASAAGLATLCGYRGLRPVITSGDFMLTEGFLKTTFSVKAQKILFPEPEMRKDLPVEEKEPQTPSLAMTTRDGLASIAYGITGARALKSASTAGIVIHMAGGILGIAMMLVLAILGAVELLTPGNLFLYELVWMIPGLLITEWTRHI